MKTQYTATATATTATLPTKLNEVMSGFKRHEFGRFLVNRSFWAERVGIERTTIYRWEKEIIRPNTLISFLYYNFNQLLNKDGLDGYQRFLIVLIALLKRGLVTGRSLTNEEVVNWLNGIDETGNQRWTRLKRDQFEKWIQE